MVIVSRKIKICFLVSTNRTLTQIRNYVNNTVYPEWDTALQTAFAGFPSLTSEKDVRINQQPQLGTNIWEVYPKYIYSADVTAQTADAARAAQASFIDDVRTRTRNLLASLTGTTVLQIFKDDVDGNTIEETP